jgi:hypothetical protein
MQHSPEYSCNPMSLSDGSPQQPAKAATIVYQSLTIAAMVLLLGSMWVF